MAKSNRPIPSSKSTAKTVASGKSHPKTTVKTSQTGRYVTVGSASSSSIRAKVKPESELQRIINRTVSQVQSIITSMDADQKEIDSLRAETRANLDKTQAVLDTF